MQQFRDTFLKTTSVKLLMTAAGRKNYLLFSSFHVCKLTNWSRLKFIFHVTFRRRSKRYNELKLNMIVEIPHRFRRVCPP
jgi:hypothetical protein